LRIIGRRTETYVRNAMQHAVIHILGTQQRATGVQLDIYRAVSALVHVLLPLLHLRGRERRRWRVESVRQRHFRLGGLCQAHYPDKRRERGNNRWFEVKHTESPVLHSWVPLTIILGLEYSVYHIIGRHVNKPIDAVD